MPDFAAKLSSIQPELALFIAVCVVMIMGLSRAADLRRASTLVAGLGLLAAFILSLSSPATDAPLPLVAAFVKPLVCFVGMLLLLGVGAVDHRLESSFSSGTLRFDALYTARGEFLCFFLLSLIGVMLCSVATDLIWLFLALELTSLPTYLMVALSRDRKAAQESGVKYFFLGALAAAIFLYGFALLYGATGSLHLSDIRAALSNPQTAASPLVALGFLLAFVGVSFKIAAVPMHFYTADVYQGASASVSAFLAFVPKTAGFITLMLLLTLLTGDNLGPARESLPQSLYVALWVIAVLTMTVGNVLALRQRSVKRVLAYSSIAHSGYMMIGLLAGPADAANLFAGDSLPSDGYSAILFYLLSYGVMNLGAFLVLGWLQRAPLAHEGANATADELDSFDDIAGLGRAHPIPAAVLSICALSLLGLPPLLGFFGKLYLFSAGIAAGEIPLVIIAGLNSAIAAWYYLQIAGLPWLAKPASGSERISVSPFTGRRVAATLSAVGVFFLLFFASSLMRASHTAARVAPASPGLAVAEH